MVTIAQFGNQALNSSNLNNPINLISHSNTIISHNLLDEPKFFDSFSTYKILSLELISIFCNIRKNKSKNEAIKNDLLSETASENSALLMLHQWQSKDYDILASQELKIINLILQSIKNSDLDVNYILNSVNESGVQIYLKLLNDRMEGLSKNSLIELRNLMNDLKIYFIGQLNDPLIRPWSVVGRYVRRCIIIYEKMSFDKLVILCKHVSVQFKQLSLLIAKNRQNNFNLGSKEKMNLSSKNTSNSSNTATITTTSNNAPVSTTTSTNVTNQNININKNQNDNTQTTSDNPMDEIDKIDNSNSPMSGALFLNDEYNLTMTSDYLNRSANADYSGMDLDESLSHSNSIINLNNGNISTNVSLNTSHNRDFINKFYQLNAKALTSTVSAQRTQLSNFKSLKTETGDKGVTMSNSKTAKPHSTVTFNIKPTQGSSEINPMPPPMSLPNMESKLQSTKIPESQTFSNEFSFKSGCAFSRKIAEYFVAQQANLIENSEHDALNPVELQFKIDELLAYDSNFADAYYLKYLNFLRLRDYPSALKSLHDYFDRAIFAGSVSLAALNLCSLEYRFDNRENAMFALKEAITSAHHEGDTICLQHCLNWLYKMESFSSGMNVSRKNFLIKSACSRSINNDLYNLASYNLHYFAKVNIGRHRPESILNLINKTDIINLKMNSRIELSLINTCHKASLWNLYGQRKICSLYSQLLLNLIPSSNSRKLNTESQCIAMCHLALDFSRNGLFGASQNIIDFCKEIYSVNTKISEHWIYTENVILADKYLLNGKWNLCRLHIEKSASINFYYALLLEMNLFILEGNIDKAKETGNKILLNMNIGSFELSELNNLSNNNNNSNSQFEFWKEQLSINLKLNFILIYISLREYSNALITAIKFFHEVKQLDLNYELMISCLIIAKILIYMEYPEQAIKYLEKAMVFVMCNGSLLDQAKLHYLYAKCLHMIDKTKNTQTSIDHMNKCIEKLETIQGSVYLIAAYGYLSLLLNESGNLSERNKFAYKFRQLRQQLPLVGFLL